MSFWIKDNGRLLINDTGKAFVCNDCPCDDRVGPCCDLSTATVSVTFTGIDECCDTVAGNWSGYPNLSGTWVLDSYTFGATAGNSNCGSWRICGETFTATRCSDSATQTRTELITACFYQVSPTVKTFRMGVSLTFTAPTSCPPTTNLCPGPGNTLFFSRYDVMNNYVDFDTCAELASVLTNYAITDETTVCGVGGGRDGHNGSATLSLSF